MDFLITPEEAQTTARAVASHLQGAKFKVSVETSVDDDLRFRPTLHAERDGLLVLVEAQGQPSYTKSMRELATWATLHRKYCRIYIATSVEARLSGQLLKDTKRAGVGIMIVDEEGVVGIDKEARNPALIVTPEPTLKLAHRKTRVHELVEQFNDGHRKAALHDMCELVEDETEVLIVKAARASIILKSESEVERMDWSTQINVLASAELYVKRKTPLLSQPLKDDLQSFKGARNLLKHKVRTKKDEQKRERQFAERMMMGPRLVADLIPLQRKAR
jgi:hypothetical protein